MQTKHGLQPLKRKLVKRFYSHKRTFGSFPISQLPAEYILSSTVLNQGASYACFPANTPVLMEDLSYKPIQGIDVGDFVFTHKGIVKRVNKVFNRVWQGKMVTIKTKGDYRDIKCTPEHPFLYVRNTSNGHGRIKNDRYLNSIKPEFVKAKDIRSGGWIAYPKIKYQKDTALNSFEKDPEFLWVFGLYLAEGWVNEFNVVFSLHIKEVDFVKKVSETMSKYGANVTIVKRPPNNSQTVYIHGKKWAEIFEELGNKYCHSKEINRRLMVIDPKLQMSIVRGIIDGDGYDKKKRTGLVMTSYELLNQVRTILFRNGIVSSFHKRKERTNRLPSWYLEFTNNPHHATYLEDDNYFYLKVVSVGSRPFEYFGGGNVYNLEVEEDNSYLVNGWAVHNCTAYSASAVQESQEGIPFDPDWLFKQEAVTNGSPSPEGYDLEVPMRTVVKYGIRPLNGGDPLPHKDDSYFDIDGDYDLFDNIRVAMWLGKDEKRCAMIGTTWNSEWTMAGVIPTTYSQKEGGHAIKCCGWKTIGGEPYLVIQNSYGTGVGENGFHFFPRSVVNKEFKLGHFCWRKTPDPNQIKRIGFLVNLIAKLVELYNRLFENNPVLPVHPVPIDQSPPPPVKVSKLLQFCEAIKKREGMNPEYNNPGAIKGMDGHFLKFGTYADGWQYLLNYVKRVVNYAHDAYPKGGNTTILEYFAIYSPRNDNNDPVSYAKEVAAACGVPPETKLSEII